MSSVVNNAVFFCTDLLKMFEKWDALTPGDRSDRLARLARFAVLAPSLGLRYEVGEIVKYGEHYAKVTGYGNSGVEDVYDRIVISSSLMPMAVSVAVSLEKPGEFKTRIPDELFEFVAGEIRGSCPLKEPGCRS